MQQDPWKLYSLAANLPCVTSGFMKVEQAMFCLAWKHTIQPSSNASVVYNAMGPDITTVLLSTNATEVVAVEKEPVRADALKEQLNNWKTIHNPVLSYPQSITALLPIDLQYDAETRLLKRTQKGYWNIDEIYRYGIATCVLIELIMLGVELSTIRVKEERGKVKIAFNWNFPDEKARQRVIHYAADSLNELLLHKK